MNSVLQPQTVQGHPAIGPVPRKNQENRQKQFQNTGMRCTHAAANTRNTWTGLLARRCNAGNAVHGRHPQTCRRSAMKWETPKAVDHRLGFEITMYVAVR